MLMNEAKLKNKQPTQRVFIFVASLIKINTPFKERGEATTQLLISPSKTVATKCLVLKKGWTF